MTPFRIILASPFWGLSGVNVFSVNLVRGLLDRGISAHILLSGLDYNAHRPMQLPADIPVERLPVKENDNWHIRWRTTIRYLEEQAPCIYIPNADFQHSCVSPKLSNSVGIVGIVHSDDPMHYEHVARLGKYWNAIVAVSKTVAEKTVKLDPVFSQKLVVIPYGVSTPSSYPQRRQSADAPLRVVYAGRLVQYQKRILDLPKIVEASLKQQVSIKLSIIGSGLEQEQLIDASKYLIEKGAVQFLGTLSNEKVLECFEQNDVFILTSDFEGLPVSLIEAMGRGCIPVVTDINSGIPELIGDGENGYRIPVGDIQTFAARLATLQKDVNKRREISLNAYRTISENRYRTQDMVESYIKLFQQVIRDIESGSYRRPRGKILIPPYFQRSAPNPLLAPVRTIGQYGKRILSQIHSAVKTL